MLDRRLILRRFARTEARHAKRSRAMNTSDGSNPTRAAVLRMSSENQRYSTENQQNAIAEYAEQHGYAVVASYIDAGKSGLSLKGRDALKQLLSDALAEPRAFDAILVLDVTQRPI
jgi:predicted site-specific integrase-resolvase